LLKTIANKFQRFRPESASVRNVLKLAGGTAGSQVIAVAAAPILTRLYGPESFGILATFASILALLNVVSSLRYELAIAVPEDEDDAIALVWLCFLMVAISTGLTALGVGLLGNNLVSWLHQPSLKSLLWLLPVGVLLTGIYQPLTYWTIRNKQFGLLAQAKFSQNFLAVATNLVAAPLGTSGLLLGQIVMQSAGLITILQKSITIFSRGPNLFCAGYLKTLKRYRHFAIYSSPAGLVNMLGFQLPTLIFASAFGPEELGQLAIAQRLLLLPAGLIGDSVSQVFLGKASECIRLGTLNSLVKKTGIKLFVCGILISLAMSIVVAPFATYILGDQWEAVKRIIPLLTPLLIGQLTVSTLSMSFFVIENNKLELLAQAGQAMLRLCALLTIVMAGQGFESSVFAFSAGSLIGYVFYASVLVFALRRYRAALHIATPS
jgi:O-antigen/teichoic acid export membrane protein